jgi:hypothetical protein
MAMSYFTFLFCAFLHRLILVVVILDYVPDDLRSTCVDVEIQSELDHLSHLAINILVAKVQVRLALYELLQVPLLPLRGSIGVSHTVVTPEEEGRMQRGRDRHVS